MFLGYEVAKLSSEDLGLALSSREFTAAVRFRLGVVLQEGKQCAVCKAGLDSVGLHALQCRSGGDVIHRHNALRDCLYASCSAAALGPRK